jgi:short subunit dehydrogenase-like uncharacterized protein
VDHIKVAIVARHKQRLEEVKQTMVQINAKYKVIACFISNYFKLSGNIIFPYFRPADVHDQQSVDDAIKQAKVVINTVGPYTLYG